MITAFGALTSEIPRALLVNRTYYASVALLLARPIGGAVHIERTLVRGGSVVKQLAKRGLVVNVWTVNDANEARDLARLGVDGIITDVPDIVIEAVQ